MHTKKRNFIWKQRAYSSKNKYFKRLTTTYISFTLFNVLLYGVSGIHLISPIEFIDRVEIICIVFHLHLANMSAISVVLRQSSIIIMKNKRNWCLDAWKWKQFFHNMAPFIIIFYCCLLFAILYRFQFQKILAQI